MTDSMPGRPPSRERNAPGRFRPVKVRAYGSHSEVAARAFDQVGGMKEASVVLGLGSSQTYAYSDPGEAAPELRHKQLRALARAGALAVVEDLAYLAGALVIQVQAAPGAGRFGALSAAIAREYGEFMAVALAALDDGRVTPREARMMLVEIDDALAAQLAMRQQLVAVIEGGADGDR